MKVTRTERQGVAIFSLDGRFDASRAHGMRDELLAAIDQGQGKVVVDLSRVTLVDSNGLTALVAGMKRARQNGGDVRLAGLPQNVRVIFELTRLDRAFELFDETETAVKSFAN